MGNVDLYRPGGVLRQPTNTITRERLQEAVSKDIVGLDAPEAIEVLQRVLAEARAVGVRETSPDFKRAAALLGTLEGSTTVQEPSEAESDPQKDQLDALFGGGYVMPDVD